MKTLTAILVAALTLFTLSVGSCGQPPQPVDPTPASSPHGGMGGTAGMGPASGTSSIPSPHAEMGSALDGDSARESASMEEARVSGTIVLEGPGFVDAQGMLFVNVRPKGSKAPWLSRMYPIAGVEFGKTASGAKTMAFELRSRDPENKTFNLNGLHAAPVECEVYACYKAERFVESKTLADAIAVFESGKTDYTLSLHLP